MKLVFAALILLVFLAACQQQEIKSTVVSPQAPQEPAEAIPTSPEKTSVIDTSGQAETSAKEPPLKEFTMTAKQFEFIPSTIEVDYGDKVRIKITSADVTHGFSLTAFGINERIEPGKEVVVEFIADRKGEFAFFCSVPCGSGHGNMRGKLIVK